MSEEEPQVVEAGEEAPKEEKKVITTTKPRPYDHFDFSLD
jgi:hypothetical protein